MCNEYYSMEKFNHKLVSSIESKGVNAKDLPDDFGEESGKVKKFALAIANKLRGIKFAPFTTSRGNVLWVYYPDELFARGRIDFSDRRYSDSVGETIRTYNVWSPFIQNNKSDKYNREVYYKLSSVNMKTAVRNAVKHLREYSPTNVLFASYENFRSARSGSLLELGTAIDKQSREISGSSSRPKRLFDELKHLVASGHSFIDPTFKEDLEKYITLEKEQEDTLAKQEYTFVYVKGVGNDQEIYTLSTKDLTDRLSYLNEAQLIDVESELGTSSELTDHLLSRVSVLMPMDKDKFLEDIGYKFCDEVYYVYNS
tara:strand:+ start:4655 stop:5593 length:939 start_codon:yes stop_codon:yes gene_type:complete